MKLLLTAAMLALGSFFAPMSGSDVVVKINGKEARDLSLNLYQKPGGYKPAPKTTTKRAKLQEVAITAPTDGLDGPSDSLDVRISGFAGSTSYYKTSQHVAPGGTATFALAEAAAADYTPNGKQPTFVGRFEVDVAPLKRANLKGAYKGLIILE